MEIERHHCEQKVSFQNISFLSLVNFKEEDLHPTQTFQTPDKSSKTWENSAYSERMENTHYQEIVISSFIAYTVKESSWTVLVVQNSTPCSWLVIIQSIMNVNLKTVSFYNFRYFSKKFFFLFSQKLTGFNISISTRKNNKKHLYQTKVTKIQTLKLFSSEKSVWRNIFLSF